ncbi:MAG: PAS domain S-box protein [Candidatus Aenigmarchaeota archaeon]|nr:PAS domain S-box protein [Candidatus Aenigmarchaeota archaeon]
MESALRKTGVESLGDMPWGVHFCQLYSTKEDMLKTMIPYFKSGLENNEFCVMVSSQPGAAEALKAALPDFYTRKGQILTVSHDEQLAKNNLRETYGQAIKNGFDGLRLAIDGFGVEKDRLNGYENALNNLRDDRVIALCTLPVSQCDAPGIIGIIGNHQFALTRHNGGWHVVENFSQKEMEQLIKFAENRFAGMLDNALIGMFKTDLKGDIVYANEAFARMFEFGSVEELARDGIASKWANPEKRGPYLERLKREGRISNFVFEGLTRTGKKIILLSSVILEGGEISGIATDITEFMKMRDTLKESEDKYHDIVETANEGIWMLDAENRITYANGKVAAMLGYAPEELIGMPFHDFLCEEEKAEKRAQSDEKEAHEHKFICKDGTPLWAITSVTPMMDKEGKFAGSLGMLTDITQRKKTEERLLKLSHAVEQSHASIIITDTKGNIEYVNPYFVALTGYTREEVIGKNPRLLKSGKQTPEVYRDMWDTIKSGGDWQGEFCNRKKNGELYWERVSVSPVKDSEGRATHFVAVKEDITESKRLEKEREEIFAKLHAMSAEMHDYVNRLNAVFASLTNPLIVCDTNETVIGSNAAARIFMGINPVGCTMQEIGRKFFLQPDKITRRALHGKTVKDVELRLKDWSGTERVALGSAAPIMGKSSISGAVFVWLDITDTKKSEETAKEALKEKEILLQEVHHRVKNNLQIISSMLNLQSMSANGKSAKVLEESKNRIRSIALVHEILYQTKDFEKISSKEYLEKLITELKSSYGISDKITTDTDIQDTRYKISTAIPCGLIVNELFSNSIKHAFPGGKGKITLTLHSNGKETEMLFTDNGKGMSGITLKKPKTLGLKLIEALTNQLDGKVELVKSKGTTFRITFPNGQAESLPISAKSP